MSYRNKKNYEGEISLSIPQLNKGVFEQLFEVYFNSLHLEIPISELPSFNGRNKRLQEIFKKIDGHTDLFQVERLQERITQCKKQLYSANRRLIEQIIIEAILSGKDYLLSEKREQLKTYLYYFIRPFYYNGKGEVFSELTGKCFARFKRIATEAQICKELTEKLNEILERNRPKSESKTQDNIKLKWKSTPAVLGCLLDELIAKGYLERPTSSFAKDANIYLQIFDIDTTPATLTKELSDRTNSLCIENKLRLALPKTEQLK